jgi:hypothetical protein
VPVAADSLAGPGPLQYDSAHPISCGSVPRDLQRFGKPLPTGHLADDREMISIKVIKTVTTYFML